MKGDLEISREMMMYWRLVKELCFWNTENIRLLGMNEEEINNMGKVDWEFEFLQLCYMREENEKIVKELYKFLDSVVLKED